MSVSATRYSANIGVRAHRSWDQIAGSFFRIRAAAPEPAALHIQPPLSSDVESSSRIAAVARTAKNG